jgi:hypothetical protein
LKPSWKNFEKKEGRDPFLHVSTLPSYDVAMILAGCLTKAESHREVDAAHLLGCFYATKGYSGISGSVTVDPDGVTRSFHHILATLKGSKAEVKIQWRPESIRPDPRARDETRQFCCEGGPLFSSPLKSRYGPRCGSPEIKKS